MKVMIPIAGRGTRFSQAGITTPKPLVPILGRPMIAWALDSLPFVSPENLIFVALREHEETHQIGQKLRELFGKAIQIIYAEGPTEGAACTVLLAKDLINRDEELLLTDTDHHYKVDWPGAISAKEKEIAGIIAVFEDDNPKWSFTKVDDKGFVTEVAEKKPISKWANVGSYHFSHGRDFVWAAEEMIGKNLRVNNEFYVAPVYNQLIERGDKIGIVEASEMWEMGTPEDIKYFEKHFPHQR